LLFNPSKPFSRGNQNADVDLMIDCLVSCFRINPHNNQHFKVRTLLTGKSFSTYCWWPVSHKSYASSSWKLIKKFICINIPWY